MKENSILDKKSLSIIEGKTANWKELAKDCVCFANSYGGKIIIGIEDEENQPLANQIINPKLIEEIQKRISSLTINVGIAPKIVIVENGGEYIELSILRNSQSIASTTDGKYYMRVSDNCKPVLPDDIERLFSEKNAFVWEDKTVRKIPLSECDVPKLNQFLKDVRSSERVSQFIKEMSDEEIVDHYFLTNNGILTNLGLLWIGKRKDRAVIHYPPAVQFIKYDIDERKVFKKVWDDFSQNPKELINDILTQIPDWNEFVEVSDGIFRKNI
ncbi:MAG: helix-turn-helix domain-containing protein, partial [Flavobacterium sp.]